MIVTENISSNIEIFQIFGTFNQLSLYNMSIIIIIKRACFARTFNRRGLKVPLRGTFSPCEKRTRLNRKRSSTILSTFL